MCVHENVDSRYPLSGKATSAVQKGGGSGCDPGDTNRQLTGERKPLSCLMWTEEHNQGKRRQTPGSNPKPHGNATGKHKTADQDRNKGKQHKKKKQATTPDDRPNQRRADSTPAGTHRAGTASSGHQRGTHQQSRQPPERKEARAPDQGQRGHRKQTAGRALKTRRTAYPQAEHKPSEHPLHSRRDDSRYHRLLCWHVDRSEPPMPLGLEVALMYVL